MGPIYIIVGFNNVRPTLDGSFDSFLFSFIFMNGSFDS